MSPRTLTTLLLISVIAGSASAVSQSAKRMVVLGIDGMDPALLAELMAADELPNLARLADTGGFRPLGTSTPPQSPVAWSNFITGMDPGGHGIFDFLALDRDRLIPYLSTAKVEPGRWGSLTLGSWQIPLSPDQTVQLRHGEAFWELLEANGVQTTMFRIPANYPPVDSGGNAISGMGTPDLQGTPGTFVSITDDPSLEPGPVSGGVIRRVEVRDGMVETFIEGPPNVFRVRGESTSVPVTVFTDPTNPVVLVRLPGQDMLLEVGEWSDWIKVEFEMVPMMARVGGMIRIFVRQTTPHFHMYVSPVNIDPREPAQRISTPPEYAEAVAEAVGPFYTQEMPEDTKALAAHVLSPREFLAQSALVLEERRHLLAYELERFRGVEGDGLLFFYISSVDQRNHMLARQMDPTHPFHEPDTPPDLASAMRRTYKEIDDIVGWVVKELGPETTLIVMSDHGFAPFRRQAHLNSWLEQKGYLTLKSNADREDEWLQAIDWSKTRAFALGLNSLYLNVRGRERNGIVNPTERAALAREIADELAGWHDSDTGAPVVTQPALREDVYHGPYVETAPDIIVGYARGYRASWATTTGKVPASLIEDNRHEWSGDHCMDSRTVPGVLLSNRLLAQDDADLRDLTVTILEFFDVPPPPQMLGQMVFHEL